MSQIQCQLDKTLGVFEKGLNYAGYVPLVSTFSGELRINYGQIEIIGGIIAGALTAIAALFNPNEEERKQGLNKAVEIIINYSLHGMANIFRGVIEMIPFLSWFTCLPYDLAGHRYTYQYENASPTANPIASLQP